MKIIHNYFYNVSYQLLVLIAPLVTIPYIARVIGPVGVGINAYTNSVVGYFCLIGSLGITLYGSREIAFHRDNLIDRSRIFWEITLLQIATTFLASIIFLIFLKFEPHYQFFFLLQATTLLANAFDISWYFMGLEDFRKTVLRDAIIRVFSIACIFLFIHKPSNLWLYILIVSGSGIFGNLSLWPYLLKSVHHVPFKQLHFSRHLKPAVILFIPTVSIQLYIMINKIMLKNMVSVQAAGFMDYSDSFINASMILVTSLSMVLLPRITNLFANNKIEAIHQSLYKSFQFITALAVPLMFGLAVVAPHFTVWFLTPKFAVTGTLLIIQTPIILLIAWNNTIGKQYLLPVNRMRDYTLSIVNGVFVNFIANYFCIYYLGVYGAAFATVLTEIFVTSYQVIAVRHQLNLSLMFHDFGKFFLAGALMGGILLFTTYLLPLRLLSFIFEIILGVLIYSLLLYLLRTDLILQLIKRVGIDRRN
ncbi:oligosaccharide flippase family protein [Oenococcus sp. UCMA 16435]|nr:oligosaccharide flippase family protein [Oenococcus sp. UCMA 16435]MDI4583777.1 oligosaccharide flippase family protein [Oenococcus sp. UCMA 14587]